MQFEILTAMNEVTKHDIVEVFKVIGINGSALAIVTWSTLIDPLKVISLAVGIGYGIWKFYTSVIRHKWRKEDRQEEAT